MIEMKVTQPHFAGVERPLKIIGDVFVEQVGVAVAQAADLELVEMRVGPAHRRLQDVVQLGERRVERYDEAAPDRRLDVLQHDVDLDSVRLPPDGVRRDGGVGRHGKLPPFDPSVAILHRHQRPAYHVPHTPDRSRMAETRWLHKQKTCIGARFTRAGCPSGVPWLAGMASRGWSKKINRIRVK